jgi:SecD/SecF fusion protein
MKKKNKVKVILGFLLIVVLTVVGGMISYQGIDKHHTGSVRNINLGLDLAGGVSITYEVQGDSVSQKDIDDTIYKLQQRVDSYSKESEVYQEGDDRIKIEIPGVSNANEILEELGQPGSLSFISPEGEEILTGSEVKSAEAKTGEENGTKKYYVALELNKKGTKAFASATKEFINQPIYIVYDNQIISYPTVNSEITNGECVIEGMESYEAASNLASSIRIGALPVELKELSSSVLSAKLGAGAITSTLKAGAIGLGLVALFMIIVYLIPGFCATIALASYTVLMLLALNGFNVTLTLPGLAGIILTIGMAVDANVIIYTRIREEIATGKNVMSSIKAGFSKASSAILDGNITTLIAAAVLYVKGTGFVKGFAETLAMGILISMFTALVVSRILAYAFYYLGFKDPKFYGKQMKLPQVNFVKLSKRFMLLSLVVILAGFAYMPVNKSNKDIGHILNYSLEFSGGTSSTITFNKDTKVDDALEKKVTSLYEDVAKSSSVQTQKVKSDNQIVVKSVVLTLDQREELEKTLTDDYDAKSVTCENVSPTISSEMQSDAVVAVIIATICMLIYIALRFKDLKFGGSAVLALIHDVLCVLTVYSIGRLTVGNNFIACMLTIVGYSINATIIIFDRIRENLKHMAGEEYTLEDVVNTSINQTFTRSLNTSITTFIMVFCLFILGSSSIREFALTLMAGIVFGGYSSICITGPIWYLLKRGEKSGKKAKAVKEKKIMIGKKETPKKSKRTGKRQKRHTN